jgi:hypothetical protein
MNKLLLVFFTFILSVSSWAKNWVHSASLGASTLSSDSDLKNFDKESILRFRPNVVSGTQLGVEFDHFSLGYFFSGKNKEFKNLPKSRVRDVRFNFHYSHFDFRLSDQKYDGAVVDEAGVEKFYGAYQVRSTNGRAHFYRKKEYLNFVRDGRHLLEEVIRHEGFDPKGSWFLGMNFDDRRIALPKNLDPAHNNEVTQAGVKYESSFSAFSWGPLVGYDGILQYSRFFLRGKLALGPAFQSSGGTVEQSEVSLKAGVAWWKRHLLTVGYDLYAMSFKSHSQRITNNNALIALNYTYAF